MSAPDYYRILHVQPDAPAPIIHASYRTLVQRAFGGTGGSAEIALLDTAYAVLGDPQALALQQRWEELGDRLFLDPAVGSWHHELTPEGAVGSGTWAGKPDAYHLAQMLLLPGRPVRGSVAAAVLASR